MVQRQLPPRYAVRYEDTFLSTPARPRVGDERDDVHAHDALKEREATTLAGARSILRALQRRRYSVRGIYERINLRFRPSLDEHTAEYTVLVCGKLAWEWDSERPVDE
jgi:hypothetical protein